MRISDWSSDVCSSDLVGQVADVEGLPGAVLRVGVAPAGGEHLADGERGVVAARRGEVVAARVPVGVGHGEIDGDRKSVVKGKSVSVRVDLGGRRIIKKKIITSENALRLLI